MSWANYWPQARKHVASEPLNSSFTKKKKKHHKRHVKRDTVCVPIQASFEDIEHHCAVKHCYRMRPCHALPRLTVVHGTYEIGLVESVQRWASGTSLHPRSHVVSLSHLNGPLMATLTDDRLKESTPIYCDISTHHVATLCSFFMTHTKATAVFVVESPYSYEYSPLRRIQDATVVFPPKAQRHQVVTCVREARDAWVDSDALFDAHHYNAFNDPREAIRAVYMDYVVGCGMFASHFCSSKDMDIQGGERRAEQKAWDVEQGSPRDVLDYVSTVLPTSIGTQHHDATMAHDTLRDCMDLAESYDALSLADALCAPTEQGWVGGLVLHTYCAATASDGRIRTYHAQLKERRGRNAKMRDQMDVLKYRTLETLQTYRTKQLLTQDCTLQEVRGESKTAWSATMTHIGFHPIESLQTNLPEWT